MTSRQHLQLRNVIALTVTLTALFSLWTHYTAVHTTNDVTMPLIADQRSPTEKYIDTLTLEEKIAGLLILHTPGTSPSKLAMFMDKHQPAGLILMSDNIPPTLSELGDITTSIHKNTPTNYPALIAIDEEGCSVKRLKADTFRCAPMLGSQPPLTTERAFAQRSRLLEEVGINLNFGIVADTTSNPNSFIYPRVFGGDARAVSSRVVAAVEGSKPHTLTTLKHFPGHGATTADSHSAIPVIRMSKTQWLQNEALPFEAGVSTGADVLMFGHLIYADIDSQPASLSADWHTIARKELGFDGLIVTDDMIMLQQSGQKRYADPDKNALAALEAGATLLLFVNNHGSTESRIDIEKLIKDVSTGVENGQLSEEAIDSKLKRVLTVREQLQTSASP